MLYPTLRLVAGVALRWYYREVTVVGAERIPRSGPVLLTVNHPNALVDALVVGWVVPRRVRITAKAVLFENPLLAPLLRAVGVIPLRRASDELARRREHRTEERGGIDPDRNAAAFDAIVDALDEGSAVLIFPEGKSHDQPDLAPLKTGPARIALAAREAGRAAALRIVPIGLVFESKAAIRSRVAAVVGEPIHVGSWEGDGAPALTGAIAERLRSVVLAAPTPERLQQVQRLARHTAAILASDAPPVGADLSLGGEFAIATRVARGLDTMDAMPAETRALAGRTLDAVETFAHDLEREGIPPTDAAISLRKRHGARFALRETLLLALLGPLALWGRATHWVPFRLARRLALRDVTAHDQPAMRTIVLGLAFVLVNYVVQGAVVWWLAGGIPAVVHVLVLPLAADVDLRYTDRLHTAWKRMRAYRRLRRDPALAERLASRRAELAAAIRELDARTREP